MKKKYIFSWLIAIFVAGFVSCTQNEDLPNEMSADVKDYSSYKVSVEDALANAEGYMGQLTGKTRSAFRVKGVECITRKSTRSSGTNQSLPDTLFYLINYDGDQGFALISADSRMVRLLAISDEGNKQIKPMKSMMDIQICLML